MSFEETLLIYIGVCGIVYKSFFFFLILCLLNIKSNWKDTCSAGDKKTGPYLIRYL